MLLLNPRRTRTNMKLLQLVWIFLLTLCGQSATTVMKVKEDDDVILNCSFGTNIENKKFDWVKFVDQERTDVFLYANNKPQPGQQFGNRVTHFPDQLQFGNASIKITKAKTSDSGTYTCYHAITQKEVKSTVSLTVGRMQPPRFKRLKPRPEIKGASPEPTIETLDETQTSALLQCVVRGAFPKPEVVWTDSEGKILDADEPKFTKREGNKFDTVLNVTVTKTDRYLCVATQKEINHQTKSKTFVRLNGGASKPVAKAIEHTKDGVLLQCVVQDPSPELKVFWKDKSGNTIPSKEPQKTENSIILQTTVTQTNDYRCVTTEGKKDDEVSDEIHVVVPEEKSSNVVPVVIAVLITTVVVGVFAFFVGRRCRSKAGGSTPTPAASSSKEEIL